MTETSRLVEALARRARAVVRLLADRVVDAVVALEVIVLGARDLAVPRRLEVKGLVVDCMARATGLVGEEVGEESENDAKQ